ncbi:MAG TPA: hypothetical protein VIU65_02570, partial [Pyrinomonadaceae bacterium]
MSVLRPKPASRRRIRLTILFIALTLCAASVAWVERTSFAQREVTRRTSGGVAAKRNITRRIGGTRDSDSAQEKRDPRKLPKQKPGASVGVPWTGEKGVERTSEDIMLVQSYAPPSQRPRLMPEREMPERRQDLPQDPNAPLNAGTAGKLASVGSKVRSIASPEGVGGPLAPQTVGTNFTGATLADTGAFPPDSMGTVGPTQFVVFVNGRIRTFNKTTGVADGVINADPDVFFASVMTPVSGGTLNINFTSDPMVRYDRLTGRWFMTIIDVPSLNAIGDIPNRYLIAVSDAASAGVISGSTVWTFYFVQQNTVGGGDSLEFLDYPSLGIDANALYMGGNMFDAATSAFKGCSAFVIRKSSVLSGGPLVTTAFRGLIPDPNTTDGMLTPRGVDNYDPAATEGYFIGVSNAAFGRLIMRRIATPGGTPTISADILITVSSTAFPIPTAHLGNAGGNNGRLDALDDRLYSAHIRNGRLWTAHNIGTTNTGASGGTTTPGTGTRRNSVRWYELSVPPTTGTPTVTQSGTIFDNVATTQATARQFWIPTVMVSGQGHAALGYSTAGTTFRVDAATSGRLRTDTLGTTQAVNIYTASSTAYNPPSDTGGVSGRRWGDYSYVGLDPLDDMTMWTIQEFCDATNSYGVRVAKLAAPPPANPNIASPFSVAAGQSSVLVTITGTSTSGSEFYDPGTNLAPPALPFNHITASVSGGVTVNSVTYTDATHVTLDLNTTAAPAGAKNVTITNPDGQSTTANGVFFVGTPPPSPILITEFRFRGTAGASDEYIELYNNTNSPITVADTNGGTGYAVAATNTTGTNSTRCTVPNGTVIPARGHYLCTNSTAGTGYSLGGSATGDATYTTGVVDGGGLAVFSTTTVASWGTNTRYDAVGFAGITGTILFTEGTALLPSGGITTGGEYAFVRKMTKVTGGLPQDTDSNQSDFFFVSTTGGLFSTRQSTLGSPGPENLASPIVRNTLGFTLLDPLTSSSLAPNRTRDLTPVTNGAFGTMSIRRSLTNNTGSTITRLRFRIVDFTTSPSPGGGVADLRGLDSGSVVVTVNSLPVTVEGTSIETPPAQAAGGGVNSSYGRSLVSGTIINTP